MDAETKALIVRSANEAATQAVEQTLLTLGIDYHNPLDAQRDMAALRELRDLIESPETQKDLLHLRRWRKTMDSIESKGFFAAVALVCFGGIALVLYAMRIKIFGS